MLLSFQDLFEYRMNFLWQTGGMVINTLMLYAFWTAILGSGNTFPIGQYYFLISIIGAITNIGFWEFSRPIQNGDIATDLLKPYNIFLKTMVGDIPNKTVYLFLGV